MTSSENIAVALLVSILLISCSKREQKPADLTTFPLKGVVVAIDTVKHRLMISHEAIPDYMDAMTMRFKVRDLEIL